MKIEKVNENQIRCTLTKEDLAARHIKISELAYGTEKAKNLFRDMIEQANYEFGFEAENTPLMVEAIPMVDENVILQITKVEYPEEIDTRFSKFSEFNPEIETEDEKNGNLFANLHGADDILGLFRQLCKDSKQIKEKENSEAEIKTEETEKIVLPELEEGADLTKLFQFENLSQVEQLANALGSYYSGENSLYKDGYKNTYYLLLHKSHHSPEEFNKICNISSEYASFKNYKPAMGAYLEEHGTLIIKGNALEVLYSLSDS